MECLLEGQRLCTIIDVLRGETEVDKLQHRTKLIITYPLLDEVLNGLDVVVGRPLDLLHTLSVLKREVFIESPQSATVLVVADLLKLGKHLRETYQILYLYADAVSNQCCLGEVVTQVLYFVAIATINR